MATESGNGVHPGSPKFQGSEKGTGLTGQEGVGFTSPFFDTIKGRLPPITFSSLIWAYFGKMSISGSCQVTTIRELPITIFEIAGF